MRIHPLMAIGLTAVAPASAALAAETITYSYDARGRLVAVAHSGSVNAGVVTTYGHDPADNRRRVTTTGSANPPPP